MVDDKRQTGRLMVYFLDTGPFTRRCYAVRAARRDSPAAAPRNRSRYLPSGQGGGVPVKRMRVIPFILVWISASSFCSAASEVNRSWDELVRILVEGKKVTVTRMNSSEVEGKLTGITGDSITMQGKGAPQTVQRVDVYRVRYAGIRKKRALWGLAVGAVVGALAMAIPEKTQLDPDD